MKFLMRSKLFLAFFIIAVLAVGFVVVKMSIPKSLDIDFVTIELSDIKEEIDVTGRVFPSEEVSLAFEVSGKVSEVAVDTGDFVEKGDILVKLETSGIEANILQARATLRSEKAKLDELLKGTRIEEVEIKEASVSSAQVTLNESKKSAIDKISDSYTKADDAVRNRVDQLFYNPRSNSPKLNITASSFELALDVERERREIENVLVAWFKDLPSVADSENALSFNDKAKVSLVKVKSFLDKVSLIVNDLAVTSNLTTTILNTYRSDISTARTNVNTALTTTLASEEAINQAAAALFLAEEQLALANAPATPESINVQKAAVSRAEATLLGYQSDLRKRTITAPIDGVVISQKAEVGEIVSAASSVIEIISSANFKVEVNIPEIDIATIVEGNPAEIILDTYGDEVVFKAFVLSVDPSAILIEGVPTYKTTLLFEEQDSRVRSGMTADVNIITAVKKNIISIPARAVIRKNGEETVKIVVGDTIEEVVVKTGIRGSLGLIEIKEGLKVGDRVVTVIRGDD